MPLAADRICYLHDLDMASAIKEWSKLTKNGTDVAAIRLLCQIDLFFLLMQACNYAKLVPQLLHPWFYERCREYEKEPYGCLDLWAREHGKSTIITFGSSIQEILNNPEVTIGIFSHSFAVAEKFLVQIKSELTNNELLKKVFPDILYANPEFESPLWTSHKGIIVKRKGNPKEATVECSGLVDSQPIGRHYQILVYDDVVTHVSVSTPEMIQKTTEGWELSLSLGKQGGKRKIVGTRYNFADTYAHILENDVAKPRIYPATDNGKPEGEPVFLSDEYWDDVKKSRSPSILACQYLLDPLAGAERKFDIDHLQVYYVRPNQLNVYILVDPAKSMKKGSADTAMIVLGVAGNKRLYLLDGYCHKMTLSERWDKMKELYIKWKTSAGIRTVSVGYEVYGSGEVDIDHFTSQMKIEQINIPITPLTSALNSSNRKDDRIERIQPDLINHNIFVPYPTNTKALTTLQNAAVKAGNASLLSSKILKSNQNKQMYDLTEVFKGQLSNFPYGGSVDCIDGFSRIYDMSYSAPRIGPKSYSLPESDLT